MFAASNQHGRTNYLSSYCVQDNLIRELKTKRKDSHKKDEATYLKIVKNYEMMFLHPKVQAEPYSPNFVALMHQLLSSKQPEPQVTFPAMFGHVTIIV